jgi:hypothetical protein
MSRKKIKAKARKTTRSHKAKTGKTRQSRSRATRSRPKAKAAKRAGAKAAKKPATKKVATGRPKPKAAPAKPAPRAKGPAPKGPKGKTATPAVAGKPASAGATRTGSGRSGSGRSGSRRSRRSTLIRRGPNGEILAPGDLLLPGGARGVEEIQYLFRGCMAAERPVTEEAINEVLAKRGVPEGPGEREELVRAIEWARDRFEQGDVEPIIPVRTNLRRTFQGVVERARQRRREIGAFLRGLDMGHTETSHMDAHGEASLQGLMEWAARLENLVENLSESEESSQGHYVQFHRVLDQLESTTEALMIDVEQTLRRLRDRLRA